MTIGSMSYNVKFNKTSGFKVTREKAMASNYFQELLDVSFPGISKDNPNSNKNSYVVVYDSVLNKFTIVDPDGVLSAASTTASVQPGLPEDFLNTLDADLDNRIDVDGGVF
jgi:hypothetical protein